MRAPSCPFRLAVLALLAPGSLADVLTVGFPGGQYAQVSQAVAAAAPGDTILLRESSFNGFTVAGKPLVLLAEAGATLTLTGPIVVRDLAAGDTLVVRGLRVNGISAQGALQVLDCAGSVRFEDCDLDLPYLAQLPLPGALVEGCASVSFLRCSFAGTSGTGGVAGAPGLVVRGSSVVLHDSQAVGGAGSATSPLLGGGFGPPGEGLLLDGGAVFASGCALRGGAGWNGAAVIGCVDSGDGAAGLRLVGAAPSALLRDTELAGGPAGLPQAPCLATGTAGPPSLVESGTLAIDPSAARSLTLTSPLRLGETLVARFAGEPGDRVFVLFGTLQLPTARPGHPARASLAPRPLPSLRAALAGGTLDGSGSLELAWPVPPTLPLSGGALTLDLQAALLSAPPTPALFRSGHETVTFLDAAL